MSGDTTDEVQSPQPTTDDETIERESGLSELFDPRSLPLRHKIGVIGLIGLMVLPVFIGPLDALTMTSALFFAMFVMSWDAVSGYTGQISFGHGVFFAVGAYTTTLLNLGFGVPSVLSIPAGIVLAALAGVIIGVPALRLRDRKSVV